MAQDGDEEARGYLNVEVGDVGKRSVPTPSIDKKDLEKENMQKKITLVTYWVEAATRLNMEHILSVYRKEHGLLIELYQALHGERPTVVSKMNTKTILTIMRLLGERNVSDGNTLVLMEEACKRALEENSDDTESGSNYELMKDSNSEESSEDDEEESLLATAAKTPCSAAKRPSPSARSAPAKRQKNGKSPDPSKRSHHKRKRCPVEGCEFNGADLRRHLKVHVKKGEIEEDSVDRLLSVVRAGANQRASQRKRKGKAPLSGRWKKWCPVAGCDRLVIDVSRHLCNKTFHEFNKGSREVQRLVRMPRRYTGLAELEDNLIKPPPPIVEERVPLKQPPSPVADESESESDERASESDERTSESDDADEEASATPSQVSEESSEEGDEEEDHQHEEDEEDKGDGDEDFQTQPRLIEYFTDPSQKSNRHKWLVKFFQFLSRPTAGDKKSSICLQHASQMRKLLEAIDPDGNDILCLLEDDGDCVCTRWVKPNLESKKYKAGTIIYLTSFEKFLTFITHKRFNTTAPPIHADDIPLFKTVKEDLPGWRSTVDGKSHEERNQRFVDESEGLLTLEELDRIKASKTYSEARRIIIQAGKGVEPSIKDFLLARDFLLTRFSLDTGTRPGPLNNATIQEYQKGKVKDDCKVMLVAKHKRAKDGPAICPMLPELYKFMEIYVRRLCPYFAKKDENALFITNEGEKFLKGTIGRRLTQFIAKCGVEPRRRLAFVDMRKLITTEMLQRATSEEKVILRRVLAQ